MIRLAEPDIGEEEVRAVADVLLTGQLVQGRNVGDFEACVAAYVGRKHGIAVSSGTAALHLALLALDVGRGHEVLIPDFTFPATANVVELVGATPVLVDIDLETFNVDPESLRRAVSSRTRAVLPVHLFGQPADMDPVAALAREHGLSVIEDAACALGAKYRNRPCGAIGDVACLSFHPRKVITTGEGGMVLIDDDALAERLRMLRNHGIRHGGGEVRFEAAGFNYRMTDFQAALGVVQMRRLDAILARRAELAARYDKVFTGMSRIRAPRVMEGAKHAWQAYVTLLGADVDRATVQRRLLEQGIETSLGTYAVSAQPHYRARVSTMPASRRAYEASLCLPLHSRMSDADADRVARAVAEAVG